MFFKHSYLLCDSTTGLALLYKTVILSMAFNTQTLLQTAESQCPMQTANEVQLNVFTPGTDQYTDILATSEKRIC